MNLRLLLLASVVVLMVRLSGAGAPIAAKGGFIDPNGGSCHTGSGSSAVIDGASMDPNG